MSTDKIDDGASALKDLLPQHSWDFLLQLSAAVINTLDRPCLSRSPVHGVQCELRTHENRFHTAGAFSWAGSSVYSPGVKS